MSERPFAQIGLHAARAAQLRDIAAARSMTAAEQVGSWISADLMAGVVPDRTPGFVIDMEGDRFVLAVGDKHARRLRLDRDTLIALAADLEILSEATEQQSSKVITFEGQEVVTRRVGRAITIAFTSRVEGQASSATKLTLTPDLVRDVVRQIRQVIGS
ncbi:hypothetical protein ACIKTA_02125 [Hansschlegelia beijingensis]